MMAYTPGIIRAAFFAMKDWAVVVKERMNEQRRRKKGIMIAGTFQNKRA
jgi:hypothetical protein